MDLHCLTDLLMCLFVLVRLWGRHRITAGGCRVWLELEDTVSFFSDTRRINGLLKNVSLPVSNSVYIEDNAVFRVLFVAPEQNFGLDFVKA